MLVSESVLVNGLACRMLVCVCVCSLGSNVNAYMKPQIFRLSRDIAGVSVRLIRIKFCIQGDTVLRNTPLSYDLNHGAHSFCTSFSARHFAFVFHFMYWL